MENEVVKENNKKSFTNDLFDFLKEYSIIGLAIGVVIAQASKDLIDAIVKGIFTPFINLIVPGQKFGNLVFKLGDSTFDIGAVINSALTFLIVMLILYIVVKKILKRDDLIKR